MFYCVSAGNPFQVSTTKGGSPQVFNSTGTAVQIQECWRITNVSGSAVTLDCNSSSFSGTFAGSGLLYYFNTQQYKENLAFAGKTASNLQAITTECYNNSTAAGFEFPSMFQLSGVTPSNNAWSVLEDIYQTPDPAQWLAAVAFNA
jgi:hypothetical protein